MNIRQNILLKSVGCILFAAVLIHAMDVYLLGGQSNATGQGYLQNLDSTKIAVLTTEFPRPFKIDTHVQLYYIRGTGLNNGKPSETWMPLCQCSEDPSRFGPEIGFGNRMMQLHPQDTIAIVKYAKSGSSLQVDWNPGNSKTDTTQWGPEFKWFVKAVNGSLASLALMNKGITPKIRGMLWQQGESDTGYSNYATMLGHLIDRIREQWNVPNLLFVYGYVYMANPASVIRAAQRDVDRNSGTKYAKSNAFVVWTQDLELRKDDPWLPSASLETDVLHLGTAGILELGRRMADTMSAQLGKTAMIDNQARFIERQHGFSIFVEENNVVRISYQVSNAGPVAISMYTLNGKRLWNYAEDITTPGLHTRILSGSALSKGAFIITFKSTTTECALRAIYR
jgi:hypothetical protein